ncbi:3-keto-5-aminohexanoate cleavage protein [Algicella marina]|uniref:3-keto-5-aminohexanoate cleavage protein n=1 Tax=Algicella marina TaxID=2683284 RepID=A0A6P1T3J5_9RHOB|nr:3-keto-5-aminohexanoate cleavage protein [Algicella marina]QHQ35082.1 3-keto-5-aminohexanoate cleavage protein [Algicella marina]
MPLTPSTEVFITAALTGSGATQDRSPHVPRSPAQIAASAVAAARAGAAIVHIHVRDPNTGAPSRDLALYREVTELIRASDTDVILNLTAGMGGDMVFGPPDRPLPLAPGTDMAGAEERLAHIADCRPEICTLDCGTMNFAEADYVMTNTPGMLRAMAARIQALGVRPEIEIFDTGHLWLARQLVFEGLIDDPVLLQLCMGIPWGAPNDLATFTALVANIPAGWHYSAFSIGRAQMPFAAAAILAGGNIRVGLEDNLWLAKGELATNEALVTRARRLAEAMGARILTPVEVREKLKLIKRFPV